MRPNNQGILRVGCRNFPNNVYQMIGVGRSRIRHSKKCTQQIVSHGCWLSDEFAIPNPISSALFDKLALPISHSNGFPF